MGKECTRKLKTLSTLIIILVSIAITTPFSTEASMNSKTGDEENFAHTVLVEYASTTWCHYCPIAAGQIQELYSSGDHDFVYISLVADKNPEAGLRCGELDLTAYPTVFFDGGYKEIIGAQGNTTPYIKAINECGARTDVHSVDVSLHMKAHGEEGVIINLTVTEKEGEAYSGVLKVYVTEMISRWSDNEGEPYRFAMLDYAINQDIVISPMGSLVFTVTWDGIENGFIIQPENIMVVAALYDSHTGYVDNVAYATIYSDLPDTFIT
ncbi:MAG TPA: thioredoxin family protein, partial [Thermoplasmatales archaeon]|nr:thioredoxin family protein [Thermoplasmatales archaeon]